MHNPTASCCQKGLVPPCQFIKLALPTISTLPQLTQLVESSSTRNGKVGGDDNDEPNASPCFGLSVSYAPPGFALSTTAILKLTGRSSWHANRGALASDDLPALF